MGTCIKTILLNAVKTDLSTITGMKTVSLNPLIMPKGDDASKVLPYCDVVDQPETVLVEGNRVRKADFELHLYVYIHSDIPENLSADLDEMHAKVYQKMIDKAATFAQYCQGRAEKSHDKGYMNENSGYIFDVWLIRYAHDKMDPYTQNPIT